ncbi:MAG: metalloregulator ArsR/SmtB family transcription factor [Pyrinomonadaceae bacterium]|nr:metalloregulator ArsR/SmtB family transcription factor [Pyrinomonadaceae bacterium]
MKRNAKDFDMELLFRALADETRLRLLNLIGNDEVCVCYLVEALRTSQPKISRHLAYLRRAGVVEARREGKWMHYRVVEPADTYARKIFQELCLWLMQDQKMQRDRARLAKLCCTPQPPVQLQGAPRPLRIAAER